MHGDLKFAHFPKLFALNAKGQNFLMPNGAEKVSIRQLVQQSQVPS